MKNLLRSEQETLIRWDAAEGLVYIDTAHPATIRKLDKLAAAHPDAYKLVRDDPEYGAKRYVVPATLIRFGKPASAARKEAGRQRAAALHRQIPAAGEKP